MFKRLGKNEFILWISCGNLWETLENTRLFILIAGFGQLGQRKIGFIKWVLTE